MFYLQFWNSFWKQWTSPASGSVKSIEAPVNASERAASEHFQQLSDYGTQILCHLHPEQGCIYLSPNFERLTGLKAADHAGMAFYDIVHGDFRDRLKDIVTGGAATQPSHILRGKLRYEDGRWHWQRFSLHAQQDGGYACIIDSIQDYMQTQNRLQKARLEAELALRSRSEFLANMSHDLRTPLNAIIGFSQIIESEIFGKIENPQYRDYMRHIQQSGYDLLAQIEDLLEISNIDAGRVTLNKEDVLVGDILRQISEAQTHHAAAAKVTLECVPPQQDITVHVDRLKMQHILGHLVANAIKFNQEGGHITLAATCSDDGRLQLCVHDNGDGMPAAKLSAIKSALQEDNCWASSENRNIGLGFALTREFVSLHGGQMNVRSAPGKGTTVQITLPNECIRAISAPVKDYLRQAAN